MKCRFCVTKTTLHRNNNRLTKKKKKRKHNKKEKKTQRKYRIGTVNRTLKIEEFGFRVNTVIILSYRCRQWTYRQDQVSDFS